MYLRLSAIITCSVILFFCDNASAEEVACIKEEFSDGSLGMFSKACDDGKAPFVVKKYSDYPDLVKPDKSNDYFFTTEGSNSNCGLTSNMDLKIGTEIIFSLYTSNTGSAATMAFSILNSDGTNAGLKPIMINNGKKWRIEKYKLAKDVKNANFRIECGVLEPGKALLAMDYIGVKAPDAPDCISGIVSSTLEPTTLEPTTLEPTTLEPTTLEPTTLESTTIEPTTLEPTTLEPTTLEPTTSEPTTIEPTTLEPTTLEPTTSEPTTIEPTTLEPTTLVPTTLEPTTLEPTTLEPTTLESTTIEPTTLEPTTLEPTTSEPTTIEPTTLEPTTLEPTTSEPTTIEPTTLEPTTLEPTTLETTTLEPTTLEPTTLEPTTLEPTTLNSTTIDHQTPDVISSTLSPPSNEDADMDVWQILSIVALTVAVVSLIVTAGVLTCLLVQRSSTNIVETILPTNTIENSVTNTLPRLEVKKGVSNNGEIIIDITGKKNM